MRGGMQTVEQAQIAVTFEDSFEAVASGGTLPDGARDVLVLHAIYGYSHIEAAEMLGVAEGTCKAQLHRARGLLKERLGMEVR